MSDADIENVCEGMPRNLPSFREAFRVWLKVALNSFGGPVAQIAVMHRYLVEEKQWISESRFLHALNYCMLLPGPEAQQLAIYIGWLLHRIPGGIVAGTLFVIPGFVVMLILSILYAGYQDLSIVQWLFFGLKPAVLAVVIEAVVRIGKRVLKNRLTVTLAGLSFIGIFFFDAPFPLIVVSAAIIGYVGGRLSPTLFEVNQRDVPNSDPCDSPVLDELLDQQALEHVRPSASRAALVTIVWTIIWFAPIALILVILGSESVYFQEVAFFNKAAVVTFGGAYAVLAYVAQQAVESYKWVTPGEMLDGLGMAETAPGPLIKVLMFVGFLAAFRNPGGLPPTIAGTLGAILTTWATFVPCFLWVLVGGPYVEALRGNKSLHAAMTSITAAIVGVVLNLAVWFALHTVFGSLRDVYILAVHLQIPVWNSINIPALFIAVLAMLAIFRFKAGVIQTIGGSAAIGMIYHLLRWRL
ncbi:MAG: chromate efflux transporter [Desulfomonilaceae bacterium]